MVLQACSHTVTACIVSGFDADRGTGVICSWHDIAAATDWQRATRPLWAAIDTHIHTALHNVPRSVADTYALFKTILTWQEDEDRPQDEPLLAGPLVGSLPANVLQQSRDELQIHFISIRVGLS